MKAPLIFLVALLTTILVCEPISCTFSYGRTYFEGSTSKISSTPFPSGKKALVKISAANSVTLFSANFGVERNGVNYDQVTISSTEPGFVQMIPEKSTDYFTITRALFNVNPVNIDLIYADITELDLPSSYTSLSLNQSDSLLASGYTFKMIVPKGKKVVGSFSMYSYSEISVSTSAGTFLKKAVNYVSFGVAYSQPFSCIAPSDSNELFTFVTGTGTYNGKIFLSAQLYDSLPSDTPSRNTQNSGNPTNPDTGSGFTGIIIGVIVAIIVFCCITCGLLIGIPMCCCGGSAALGAMLGGASAKSNNNTPKVVSINNAPLLQHSDGLE